MTTEEQTTLAGDVEQRVATLFDAIKHGDQEHMDWLREAIDAHFAGQPVPPSRGKGAALSTPTERAQIVSWMYSVADQIEEAAEGNPIGKLIVRPINTIRAMAAEIEAGKHLSEPPTGEAE